MRLYVHHETTYRYAAPASGVIQILRLTPRNHVGQHVVDWRIDVDMDCRLRVSEDAFGNLTHVFSASGPIERLSIAATGEVETFDTAGVAQGAAERFPEEVFLRETPLTAASDELRALAGDVAGAGADRLAGLHDLTTRIHRLMAFDPDPTHTATPASEAFHMKRGVCQDFAHVFISCARHLGVPARYVGGYFYRADLIDQEAGHAWAEAFVPDLGWVGFDPTHGVSPQAGHIRVAAGLDYLGAAPVRGSHTGGGGETLAVKVRVAQTPHS